MDMPGPSHVPGKPFTCPSGVLYPSKKAFKKHQKALALAESHRRRKEREKAGRREKRTRHIEEQRLLGRDVLAEEAAALAAAAARAGPSKTARRTAERMATAASRFTIAIDMSFDARMTAKERGSLARQVSHSYAFNRRSGRPVNLAVADLEEGSE
ncbi:hypothetical protein TeGR_g13339 [Tetraparma gracilis]|uniref:tRNA (guanine(9)-N(1))-methyltransferase n=1 Tax=Tetraparma gracilis TaxID=2962635 RepID=A0ABQ6M9Y4_9STRA|nr:hypothetical protein TeGR_g13339 [Tetraparma gracilis]